MICLAWRVQAHLSQRAVTKNGHFCIWYLIYASIFSVFFLRERESLVKPPVHEMLIADWFNFR